jgi:hypothetical protein
MQERFKQKKNTPYKKLSQEETQHQNTSVSVFKIESVINFPTKKSLALDSFTG